MPSANWQGYMPQHASCRTTHTLHSQIGYDTPAGLQGGASPASACACSCQHAHHAHAHAHAFGGARSRQEARSSRSRANPRQKIMGALSVCSVCFVVYFTRAWLECILGVYTYISYSTRCVHRCTHRVYHIRTPAGPQHRTGHTHCKARFFTRYTLHAPDT